jgi:Cu/Ag efflux protein CusF
MKKNLHLLVLLLAGSAVAACGAEKSSPPNPAPSAEKPASYPFKGVIVDVRAEPGALVVKHENIPGVMRAMTMAFRVEPATLASVTKGQTITATLYRKEGELWLRDVTPAPAAPK